MEEIPANARLLMLHKPKGYVVTRADELGRKTVYELLPEWAFTRNWQPVGRLDLESKGLLLFSKNGREVDVLTRPGHLLKIYEVWVRGKVTPAHVQAALRGVETPEGLCKAKAVEVLGGAGPKTRVRVTLDEGKNRHIRRLFGGLLDERHGTPLKVLELKRLAIGPLALDVPSGQWRFLTEDEALRVAGRPE